MFKNPEKALKTKDIGKAKRPYNKSMQPIGNKEALPLADFYVMPSFKNNPLDILRRT